VLATTKNPEHLAQEASFFIFATASLGLIIIALSLFRYFVTRVGKAVFSFDGFWARSYVWQSLSFVSCQLLLTRFPCLRHYSLATKIEMEFASSYVLVQEKEEKVAFDIGMSVTTTWNSGISSKTKFILHIHVIFHQRN